MTVLEIIKEAIEKRKPISFYYQNDQQRIGNPYAIYIHTTNNSTKVHIVQTSGYTSSGQLNKFKPFNLEGLHNVKILEDEPTFLPDHPDYKPESSWYANVIIKA